jgi:hypothetical protein
MLLASLAAMAQLSVVPSAAHWAMKDWAMKDWAMKDWAMKDKEALTLSCT